MTVIQNFAAAADLHGLMAYLGIMATLLSAVAWATYRDRQKERQRKCALATAAVPANPKVARMGSEGLPDLLDVGDRLAAQVAAAMRGYRKHIVAGKALNVYRKRGRQLSHQ
jgi:hypothetical protein